jgi:hypothetical protein
MFQLGIGCTKDNQLTLIPTVTEYKIVEYVTRNID